MFNTEEDVHKKFVNDADPNKFFDEFTVPYTVPEDTIDRTKHDAKFQERHNLLEVYKSTRDKNSIITKILKKRVLTPAEKARKVELEKKDHDDVINEEEEKELDCLDQLELKSDADINAKEIFSNLPKIYYYKDARKWLKEGLSFDEWNGEKTKSKEPIDALEIAKDENAKRLVMHVKCGDALTELIKLKNDGLNPVLAVCGSRIAPGGGWDQGLLGTEEEIFYRSTASLAFSNEIIGGFYALQDDAVLFAPRIMLYKDSAKNGFKIMNDANKEFFSLITYAPEYLPEDTKELNDQKKDMLINKLRNVIRTALYWGYNSIVFTPVGDGPPANYPPQCVVDVIKHVIFAKKHMFCTRLKRVAFVFPENPHNNVSVTIYRNNLHGVTHEI
jgi:hypothetical protein